MFWPMSCFLKMSRSTRSGYLPGPKYKPSTNQTKATVLWRQIS